LPGKNHCCLPRVFVHSFVCCDKLDMALRVQE
jgi:hypothetical protein